MVKNQTLVILGVALVVAVIASVISASITGNVIKVKKNPTGIDIYTKAEVDKTVNSLKQKISTLENRIGSCCKEIKLCKVSGELNLNEEKNYTADGKKYRVALTYISATYAQFAITDSTQKSQTTTKIPKGGSYILYDNSTITVTDISYQNFAGGVMKAEFVINC